MASLHGFIKKTMLFYMLHHTMLYPSVFEQYKSLLCVSEHRNMLKQEEDIRKVTQITESEGIHNTAHGNNNKTGRGIR